MRGRGKRRNKTVLVPIDEQLENRRKKRPQGRLAVTIVENMGRRP